MYEEKDCGVVRLLRHGEVDMEASLAQRDPIAMRTYLSLAVECLDKKKDLILAVAITEDSESAASDSLPKEVLAQGVLYLAECLNIYRFCVSRHNPNVISVARKEARDPVRQKPISGLYYYIAKHCMLEKTLGPVATHLLGQLSSRTGELSSDELAGLFQAFPVLVVAMYVGNETDFVQNSVFHQHLQNNAILQEIPSESEITERVAKTERGILKVFLMIFIAAVVVSGIFYTAKHQMTPLLLLNHLAILGICGVSLAVNRAV